MTHFSVLVPLRGLPFLQREPGFQTEISPRKKKREGGQEGFPEEMIPEQVN